MVTLAGIIEKTQHQKAVERQSKDERCRVDEGQFKDRILLQCRARQRKVSSLSTKAFMTTTNIWIQTATKTKLKIRSQAGTIDPILEH